MAASRVSLNRVPLVYFIGLVPGRYFAMFPVFVVADDPAHLTFSVAADDLSSLVSADDEVREDSTPRRAYITRIVQQRLHQRAFRERVLTAYRGSCAICRLRHEELLDAAHIVPDHDPRGFPTVSNGLALCKLHHAAFERHFLGIRPDLIVEVRSDLLEEDDGPMLDHGLKGCHRRPLVVVPRSNSQRPNTASLEERYEIFRRAGH